MRVIAFLNNLGLGGTEKAAVRWAWGLQARGHRVTVMALRDGPRRAELEACGVPVRVALTEADMVSVLRAEAPEIIHAHAPGHPHEGDVLGAALARLPKIPVVQTNIFGHLTNPQEDAWTDFRLFISWTSCVQAVRRQFRKLDEDFFRRASVAVYPLDPAEAAASEAIRAFRERLGVGADEVLFGRLSRPEPNKWSELVLAAFRRALKKNSKIKLLLREPPPAVAAALRAAPDAAHFIILPATNDAEELRLTLSALDVVLHTSLIGESFGYGIAEPMNFGKPVITHSVPWQDQAQIELVRHGEGGFIASTPAAMAEKILALAGDASLRTWLGLAAQQHIRALAAPENSLDRIETVLRAVVGRRDNPFAAADLAQARVSAAYLDAHQFGHSLLEQLVLRPFYYRVRFHQWRNVFKSNRVP